jgi:hypothetical protein
MAEGETHVLFARIPRALYDRMERVARRHRRSVSAEVEVALDQYAGANGEPTANGSGLTPRRGRGRPRKLGTEPPAKAPTKRTPGRPKKQ